MKRRKSKRETGKTETNVAFTVRVTVKFSAYREFTHKTQAIYNRLNVSRLRLKDENSAARENVGTRACSLANDLSHGITSTDICLSFNSLSHGQVSTLEVYKNAKPTRGDVITASTNRSNTTVQLRLETDSDSRNDLTELSHFFDWLDLHSVNAPSALDEVCSFAFLFATFT